MWSDHAFHFFLTGCAIFLCHEGEKTLRGDGVCLICFTHCMLLSTITRRCLYYTISPDFQTIPGGMGAGGGGRGDIARDGRLGG